MSHFYASIQGNRGDATRQGSADSGIDGHIRGWNRGINVRGFIDRDTGQDAFHVTMTSGSNGRERNEYLLTVMEDGTIEASDWLKEAIREQPEE